MADSRRRPGDDQRARGRAGGQPAAARILGARAPAAVSPPVRGGRALLERAEGDARLPALARRGGLRAVRRGGRRQRLGRRERRCRRSGVPEASSSCAANAISATQRDEPRRRAALARGADHVLLLNNDTVVDADAPARSWRRPSAGPGPRAVPGRLLRRAARPDLVRRRAARPAQGYQGKHLRDAPSARAGDGARLRSRVAGPGPGDRRARASSTRSSSPTPRTRTGRCAPARPGTSCWSCRRRRVWHHVSSATGGEGSAGALYYSVRNVLAV